MLCHTAVGACQIYVPVRVISIHYHDGYRSTKGSIVSFSLPLYNNCLFTSYSNLGNIITKDTHGCCILWVYLSEMYEKIFKNKNVVRLPIAARSCHLTFLRDKQSERAVDFSGCCTTRYEVGGVWKHTSTTKGASSNTSSGHGVVFSSSLRHFCVRCPFKCRLPTLLQS